MKKKARQDDEDLQPLPPREPIDLEADPEEFHDLGGEATLAGVRDAMRHRLLGWFTRLKSRTTITWAEAEHLARKVIHLRIFPDAESKMNRSLIDIGGELLAVSQFTLYGDTQKGNMTS